LVANDGRLFQDNVKTWTQGKIMTRSVRIACLLSTVLSAVAQADEGPQWTRNRELWEQVGGSEMSFEFAGGQLSLQRGENEPSALLTKEDYENFELSFEFLLSRWCESGVIIHAPRNGAWRAGLEIALNSNKGPSLDAYAPGAIAGEAPPLVLVPQEPFTWNTFHLRMAWPRLQVSINDAIVQDLDLEAHPTLRHKLRRGAIGIENNGYYAGFRNVKITPLPDAAKTVALFNGENLDGWSIVDGDAKWAIEEGAIVGSDGDGYLKHDLTVQDFRLQAYIRTTPIANGGIFFRWTSPDTKDRGYEVQILDVPGGTEPTGSIYGRSRGNDLALTPGQWTLLQIHAEGSEARTFVNGAPAAIVTDLEHVRPGHIVLQMHRTRARIEYKDLRMEVLDK